MRERSISALAGLAAVALTYGLTWLPGGWAIAAVFLGLSGWILGGYIRHLIRTANRDELTGVANRRPFERMLEREWERAVRYGRPLSLLFIDVDDFGAVNKVYGHLMGDETLKAVSRLMRQNVRGSDIVARWGGEEFVILLPETAPSAALVMAERIRRMVEQNVVCDRDWAISVTVSTGVAGYPGSVRSAADLLRQAIAAESAAKTHKNSVQLIS